MELFSHLALGFSVAFSVQNLFFAFLGCFLGTLVGVLPGLGPLATVSMLLPMTYTLGPTSSLIMLAGIYYGAKYGGSTTAILVNLPGESSSVVTAIDGYKMAQSGRAGVALAVAAIGSFFAGSMGTLLLAVFAFPMSKLALSFGAAEYFSLMVLGLLGAIALGSGSFLKTLGMAILGLLIGIMGTDVNSGVERFSFGFAELSQGIDLVPIAMGIFGLGEVIQNLTAAPEQRSTRVAKIVSLVPSRADLREAIPAILRGTGIGSVLGILPGGGALLSSFASYAVEKKIPVKPGQIPMGEGNIRGVAGPESADNAGAQASFIPMLTLGIPGNALMALLVGAMMIHNIFPGPQVMTTNPELFWGLIVSMWLGNMMLVILNLPLIGIWVRLLSIPYRWLFPSIILFCVIGVFSTNYSVFDVWLVAIFGLVGYVFAKLGCGAAPLILGVILGPMLEEYLRRALLLARGDWLVVVSRPLSAVLLSISVIVVLAMIAPAIRKRREKTFAAEEVG
ncbi:tripartite tricarboxylate transporter permease [Pseudochelatococcus lubricantis]|uniref:tripartite tricarboxylate transporter permease n=1 Tax=Pseudochelatococcus lubricantis TaxID=1538102 RepID=UPI0035E8FD66